MQDCVTYSQNAGYNTDEEFVGVIAQDMQKVAPYMVNEEGKYLSYNSTALMYMLVNAVKNMHELYTEEKDKRQQLEEQVKVQDERIADLEAKVDKLLGATTGDSDLDINDRGDVKNVSISNVSIEEPMLFQNEPNPFSGSTVIRYYVPEKVANAEVIIVSTENGKVLKRISIDQSGMGTMNLNVENVASGNYTYALILDGKQQLSKQMMIGR